MFAGKKSKSYNYVGLVPNVEGDEISAKLRRYSADGKPIFTFKEYDEGVLPGSDMLRNLPQPQTRREHKFLFPWRSTQWHVRPKRTISRILTSEF